MSEFREKVFSAARDGMAITIYALLCNKTVDQSRAILHSQVTDGDRPTTAFIIASRNGHDKVVKMLLKHYKVDIEQVGTVKFDGYVIEGATALWCAAGAGHFDVVRTLVGHGADVNHSTFTNSTPLRAACFDGRLDIVQYLIEHKANIHIPNKYNNTCLMIACYKGHTDVALLLLEKGADPNARAHCGATALHFSAECGHVTLVKELVRYGGQMIQNDHGMTPLHVAAECSRADIVKFFISQPECSRIDRIEAVELLGASFANDKDNYDIGKTYNYLWLALQERTSDAENVLLKETMEPVKAYGFRTECQTVDELISIRNEHDTLHMEALVIRERILGRNNPEIPHPVVFRGAVFADTSRFDRCISLWMHALNLRQSNNRSITKDLLRFAQVFSQMLHINVDLDFALASEIADFALTELAKDKAKIEHSTDLQERQAHREIYEANIHAALYIFVILTKLKPTPSQHLVLCKQIYQFCKLDLRLSKSGYTPLHLVVSDQTQVDDFHVNDIVKFPNEKLCKLLVKCGADVNAVDESHNTPLHLIVRYNKPISDFMTLYSIIMALTEHGAHIDMSNGQGQTASDVATTGVAEIIIRKQRQLSLKCFAARVVRKKNIDYRGHVPTSLESFIEMH